MFQVVWSHRDFQLGRDMAKCRPEKNNQSLCALTKELVGQGYWLKCKENRREKINSISIKKLE